MRLIDVEVEPKNGSARKDSSGKGSETKVETLDISSP